MARCPHRNVQQFTDVCLDCWRNVNESDEEYLKYLTQEKKRREYVKKQSDLNAKILELEAELGIKHPGNLTQDEKYDLEYYRHSSPPPTHYPGNTETGSNISDGEWSGHPPDCGMW